ncbi:hypothetical protein AB0D49_01015 [Streptomyces sp. NPDC048290]|uniref:hypothetical protein n=1 Tax=Streptomyces sp. NPDC048290 TaxID=3155811 RepID=UPI0034291FA0
MSGAQARTGRGGRPLRIALALIGGALAGAGVYALVQVGGVLVFAVVGAAVAVLAVLGAQTYRRSARLTEVKVTVPQLSELTFVVDDDAQRVAWQLFVESVTRVSVQRLADDDGRIREAMNSLYGLFGTVRDTLKGGRPSTVVGTGMTVEYLAITFLNQELRPFLSKWHPRLRSFEETQPDAPESDWAAADACRSELRALHGRTRQYVIGFARLAGVQDAERMADTPSPPP